MPNETSATLLSEKRQALGSIREHWLRRSKGLHLSERRLLLFLGDLVAVSAAAVLSLWIWGVKAEATAFPISPSTQWFWFGILVPFWILLSFDLYNIRAAASRFATIKELSRTAAIALITYLTLFFFAPRGMLPRLVVVCFILGTVAFSFVWRSIYIRVFVSPQFERRLLVLGAGWGLQLLTSALGGFRDQYSVVGILDDDLPQENKVAGNVPVLGKQADLLQVAQSHRISEIVLPPSGEIRGPTFQMLLEAMAKGISVVRLPSLYEEVTGRVPIDHLDVDWMVGSFLDAVRRPTTGTRMWKRSLDVIGASVGLLLTVPLLPVLAACIWLENRGPVLYRQRRLGLDGAPFEIWKLRTMVPNAEPDGRPQWASQNDVRATRVGWFLRRTRLDELPQFWNVLRGEMSLVGPRPERPEFISALEKSIPFYRTRLAVKPGLTGWAQVEYRYGSTEKDAAVKLEYDLYYIKHHSVWLDLLILWRTIRVVLGFRGT